MSLFSQTKAGVRRIFIWQYTTDNSIMSIERLIGTHMIDPTCFNKAQIKYRVAIDLMDGDPYNLKNYPLRFFAKDGKTEVWISSVNAGYRGTGPHGTLKCLELMGFSLSYDEKEELLTTKNTDKWFVK